MAYFPLTFVTYPGTGDFVGMHGKPITVQITLFTTKKGSQKRCTKTTLNVILDGAKVGAEL